MVSIVVAGPAEDRRITGALERLLKQSTKTLWIGSRRLVVPPKPPNIIVWDTPWPDKVDSPATLILLKESLQDFSQMHLPPCHGVVMGSDNLAALRFLEGCEVPVITCGLSGRDSLTLTSMAEHSAVIALQRSLPRYDGSRVEPMELPVSFEQPVDRYALLCAVAALGFCGGLGGQSINI